PVLARGETPPHESLALGPKRYPRRKTEIGVNHQVLAELQAVLHPLHPEKRVHRSWRRRPLDARNRVQSRDQEVARAAIPFDRALNDFLTRLQRRQARALDEYGHA